MPNYSKSGKNLFPLTDIEFQIALETGRFEREKHKALVVLLYYYGVRISEALRAKVDSFRITDDTIYFDVGERLKKRKTVNGKEIIARGILRTAPLPLKLDRPFVDLLVKAVRATKEGQRVFPYCRKTGYNICDRAFKTYPHRFRLTNFTRIAQEKGIAVLKSWSALTLTALEFYMGVVDFES